MRTLFLGLVLLALAVLAANEGVAFLQAYSDGSSAHGFDGLGWDWQSIGFVPVHVTGLVQEVLGRPIGPAETSLILACVAMEAFVVGLAFQLVLGDRSYGFVVNTLVAAAGAWCVLLLYDFRPDAEPLGDLNALVARALVGSVVAPAALILLKSIVASDANAFLAGGDTSAGDTIRGFAARLEDLAGRFGNRRPAGPSAERIRGVTGRRRS